MRNKEEKNYSSKFESNCDDDIEASESELAGLAYTGLFLVGLLVMIASGICLAFWY